MVNGKDLVIAVLATFCLTATLFLITTTRSETPIGTYEARVDINDDGAINILDAIILANHFGTFGTPMNATDLLARMQTNTFQSSLLLHLPCSATAYSGWLSAGHGATMLNSLSLDGKAGQSIFVYVGTTITVTGEFQDFSPPGAGGDMSELFFIYSWTPSWPPPNSIYYYALYVGIPGVYPGIVQAFTFNLTAPSDPGVYFLYFCGALELNIQDAINDFQQPLWAPVAVITVGE